VSQTVRAERQASISNEEGVSISRYAGYVKKGRVARKAKGTR